MAARLVASLALLAVIGLIAFYGWRIAEDDEGRHGPPVSGSPDAGRQAIERHACYACHTIPGVPRATANVGPPLTTVSQRGYLGGVVPNTPQNMRLWIMNPQRYSPGSAMPDLGVTEEEARDIVAYLYGLN